MSQEPSLSTKRLNTLMALIFAIIIRESECGYPTPIITSSPKLMGSSYQVPGCISNINGTSVFFLPEYDALSLQVLLE